MEGSESSKNKISPIVAYGNNILRKKCTDVNKIDFAKTGLSSNLNATLESTGGLGLAAPQINLPYNSFVVKSIIMYNDLDSDERKKYFCGDKGIEEVFINAKILDYSKDTDLQNEACLSLPGISEQVERSWEIIVEYLDKDFVLCKKQFSGYTARVIQHEYDHTQGTLFIDRLKPITKKLIRGKLRKIRCGSVYTDYPIKFK